MKPFVLSNVLRYRERMEARQQERHSAAAQRQQEALAQLATLLACHEQALDALAECQRRIQLDARAAEELLRYQETLAGAVQAQAACVQQAQQELDREREALVRAAQDRQALERLRDRHDAEQQREAVRQTAREQDGITTARYVLRRATPSTEG